MGIIAVPNPNHEGVSAVTRSFQTGRKKHADSFSVARVRPRTSKGITDLLLLTVTRLDAACPSKKNCDGRENEADRRGTNAIHAFDLTRHTQQRRKLQKTAETASNFPLRHTARNELSRDETTPALIPTNSEPKFKNLNPPPI